MSSQRSWSLPARWPSRDNSHDASRCGSASRLSAAASPRALCAIPRNQTATPGRKHVHGDADGITCLVPKVWTILSGNDGTGSNGIARGKKDGCIDREGGAFGWRVGEYSLVEGDSHCGGVLFNGSPYTMTFGISHGEENAHGGVRYYFVSVP